MSFFAFYPPGSAGSANASVGVNGSPAPTSSTEIGFINGSGNETAVSPSTPLPVTVTNTPTGTQDVNLTQVSGVAITLGQKAATASLPIVAPSNGTIGVAVPAAATFVGVRDSSSGILQPLLATAAGYLGVQDLAAEASLVNIDTHTSNIDARTPTLGQKTMAGSSPVVIASDQSAIPVSAASLPLPSGAATSALQSNVQSAPGTPQTVALTIQGNASSVPIPISGSVTTTNNANGNTGSAVPAQATQVAGSDGTNLRAFKVSSTGVLSVDGSAVTQPISGTVSTNADANIAAGTAPSKVLVGGLVYNSTVPALTTGQSVAQQADVNASSKVAVAGLTGASVGIRPDNEFRVATDASSVFYDSFESLDTTNRWTTSGTAPTAANGLLTVSPGTTALATSSLTSQPTFPLLGNMFSQVLFIASIDSGLKTGNYRFIGAGLLTGSPAVATPFQDAVGFEWLDTDGVLRGVVWSNGVKSLSVSLSSVQPTDGANHRYQIYYKSSRVYFEIDNVSVGSLSYPNPNISTLPNVIISINGASTVSPAAILNSSFTSTGDSAANNKTISDGTYPWRKAVVTSSGGLSTSINELYLAGQAAQTAVVNNILPAISSANATDVTGYLSASVQVVSTGTAGTFIFEGSDDNVNFQSMPVYSQLILTGTPITAAITATASNLGYTFPVNFRYIRLRIATTITGGSIQAFSRLSAGSWSPAVMQVAQATAANLNTTAVIASGTVTTVSTVTTVGSITSANLGIPNSIADVPSAALTTTTTTAAFTPTFGTSYMINIPVTVVSGTTPTLSVQIQESADAGTNWYTVYTFPLINTTGSFNSPVMTLTGNRVRYVQTVTGTTPSFTRAISRLQSNQANYIEPGASVFTDRSGATSGTPSTSTQVAAANAQRRYFIIQNLSSSATIYINFTSAATAGSGSLPLLPFAAYAMESSTISTEAINVLSATASVPFTCKEG